MAEEQRSLLGRIEAHARWNLLRLRRWAIERLRPVLPPSARRLLVRLDALLDPVHIALHRLRTGRRDPIPPRVLRERVGSSTIDAYFETGAVYARALETTLAERGRPLSSCRRVLDFGSGAGKVLQHLRGRGDVDWHGCDIHEPSVRWMERHLPGVTAARSATAPPLPYGDGFFDCVYGWSVFTHLDEPAQLAWLDELHRVLAPSGLLLLSVLGDQAPPSAAVKMRPDPAVLERSGFVFIPYPADGASYGEFAGDSDHRYGLTFVTADYVRSRWPDPLELVAIAPRALDSLQDIVVLRRPGGGREAGAPAAAAAERA